jgi:hypothetical protein
MAARSGQPIGADQVRPVLAKALAANFGLALEAWNLGAAREMAAHGGASNL